MVVEELRMNARYISHVPLADGADSPVSPRQIGAALAIMRRCGAEVNGGSEHMIIWLYREMREIENTRTPGRSFA